MLCVTDTREIHVADLEAQLNNSVLDVKDKESTILQFRERMKRLQAELYQYKNQSEANASESEKHSSKTNSMLNELHALRV
jgi:predicted  nucleic acid-binding Zn-ribbon protein